MADPLTGKFFFIPTSESLERGGQIRSRIRDHYLVHFRNSHTGETTQTLVSLDEMKGWVFFDDPADWRKTVAIYDDVPESAK
jgi:hypothetical protein